MSAAMVSATMLLMKNRERQQEDRIPRQYACEERRCNCGKICKRKYALSED